MATYVCCYLTLGVYGSFLFAIFGAGAMVKNVEWEKTKVEYMISPQVPSVVYNIIVLAMCSGPLA